MESLMSRALMIDNHKIYELFGGQYIPFNDINPNFSEYKVTQNEDVYLSLNGERRIAQVFLSPTIYNCYQQQLIIADHAELSIDQMVEHESIDCDPINMVIANYSSIPIFKNFNLCSEKFINYDKDDVIHIGTYLCIIAKNQFEFEITVYNHENVKCSLTLFDSLKSHYKDFPIYTNSPKLKYSIEETIVDLKGPREAEKQTDAKGVIKRLIPAMVTFTLTLILMYFKPRGIYIIISLSTTAVTVIITIVTFISDRKANKLFNIERGRIYENYLHETIRDLTKLKHEEEEILNYSYPPVDNIITEVDKNTTRLYERDIQDTDFLKINIGVTNCDPTYKLTNPIDELKINKENLELRVEAIYEKFKQLQKVPKVVDLFADNIGIVGSKSIVNSQLQNIIIQLIFFHSYHDIKIIPVIDKSERKYFEQFTFAKHLQFEDGLYTLIEDELSRDAILGGIIQILRARQNREEGSGTLPIFIFVITNFDLIANHPIMEFINDENNELGIRVIFINERRENLISNLQTIVHIKNSQQVKMIVENTVIKNEKFILNPVVNSKKLTSTIKKIGQLEHVQGVKSSLPDTVSFLELYDVERVSDLNIRSRWKNNKTISSIKALIGKKSQVDYVYLDLHEKAHGPHGLIAGTTGSGKSEVIQTYILSLATNYSPEYVGFLLIDYKGGGMANLFENMPHLLGSITNLDGYLAMRAMESIKGELKRRQSLFSQHGVNHINGYHKLYAQGKVTEPLPHLFLISDEFAELKSNEPAFMKELVSAARIGRSLGIHLILATQKPNGVVDDQIWSNSKFKLCLKVSEPVDSRELLNTTDAAYITEPGRGYLKVGTNELYELFQSGFSGAPYNATDSNQKDERVFIIDKFGREKLINKREENIDHELPDELTVVLNEISKAYELANLQPVTKPWLPPLEDNISLELNYQPLDDTKLDLTAEIGLIDIPTKQCQIPLTIDLLEDGNIGIFGSTQVGKTTTIQTILTSLAIKNSPQNLCYYILDFGNGKLVSMKALKHTADYLTIEDHVKLQRLFKNLKQEIKNRKQKLSESMASNFAGYNQVSNTPMPAIVIAFDNYDVLRDAGEILNEFHFIYREGVSLGIYIITSAIKIGSLRLPHQASITKPIQHFSPDNADIANSLGMKSNYELKEIKGRVQIKVEDPEVAQIYTPVTANSEKEYIENLKVAVNIINSMTTHQNKPLPVMPKVVEYKTEYKLHDKIFLGLDYEDVKPHYLYQRNITVFGVNGLGKTETIKNILMQVDQEIYILDDREYSAQSKSIPGRIFEASNGKELLEILSDELDVLINLFQARRAIDETYSFLKFRETVDFKVVYINQADGLENMIATDKSKLIQVVNDLSKMGYMIIIELDNIQEIGELNKFARLTNQKLYVGDPSAQSIFKFKAGIRPSAAHEAYFVRGMPKLIKIVEIN